MSRLEQEINEQPAVIAALLEQESRHVRQIVAAIRDFEPAYVCIAARGTSDNAARYAQYLLGSLARLPVMLATPSLHTLYEQPPDLSRALMIGISQSGQSVDILRVLDDARQQGALTLSITNDPDSPIAQSTAHHLYLHAGKERSVAATKTYTAQVTSIAMLAAALVDQPDYTNALASLPQWVEATLSQTASIAGWVQRYRYMTQFVALGRGYNYCTAIEVGLKIKELCYITGFGYSEADFRHGPIVLIESGFPALVVALRGQTSAVMLDLLDRLNERQAETLVITNDDDAASRARYTMSIPPEIPEWLSPVCAVIPGQVFAMQLASEKGYPLDEPRGLTKVTVTR